MHTETHEHGHTCAAHAAILLVANELAIRFFRVVAPCKTIAILATWQQDLEQFHSTLHSFIIVGQVTRHTRKVSSTCSAANVIG
jgi:hypothetical protein